VGTTPLVDPDTYETGPPFEVLRTLRERSPVTWGDEPALHGQPAGTGFWLVLRQGEVERVLRDPATFSSGRAPPRCATPPPCGGCAR
jgi:cytochrome P450